MKRITGTMPSLLLAALLALPGNGLAQTDAGKNSSASGTGTQSSKRVTFKPRVEGAPDARTKAASRSASNANLSLDVLAPIQVGLTTKEQPTLFWFQSESSQSRFELTLLEGRQTIVEMERDSSPGAGLQSVKLSDQQAKLAPGIKYKWTVALVPDLRERSKDILASAYIERIEPSAELKTRISAAKKSDLPRIYAEEGIWYDALEVFAELIAADPKDAELREARADLLKQVGLTNAADFEVSAKPSP